MQDKELQKVRFPPTISSFYNPEDPGRLITCFSHKDHLHISNLYPTNPIESLCLIDLGVSHIYSSR